MGMRSTILAVALVFLISGCGGEDVTIDAAGCASGGGNAVIEWVDAVRLGGVTYGTDAVYGRPLIRKDVGGVFAKTRCKLADKVTDPAYKLRDGDATFLKPKTALYEVNGYDPAFRLAARRRGDWVIYEAQRSPEAQTGEDLMDLEGKVDFISIESPDGPTEMGAIRNDEEVARLIGMLSSAPVDQNLTPAEDEYEQALSIAFHLQDGTITSRDLYRGSGLLAQGIQVPASFIQAIERAL